MFGPVLYSCPNEFFENVSLFFLSNVKILSPFAIRYFSLWQYFYPLFSADNSVALAIAFCSFLITILLIYGAITVSLNSFFHLTLLLQYLPVVIHFMLKTSMHRWCWAQICLEKNVTCWSECSVGYQDNWEYVSTFL